MPSSLASDEEQLRALFEATKGPSELLKRRQDCVRKLGPPPLESSSPEAEAEAAALRRRSPMNVVFLQPPEMISTGDEALAFNLKFGRYDGCFSYEKAGPRGEGFYVTDLGRSVGNRMKIKVVMKGVFEVPPPLSGGKYRYFVKPRKALAMSGKEIPEARFCILHKHVQELPTPTTEGESVGNGGGALPWLSRWTRLDGWLHDSLGSHHATVDQLPGDYKRRQQRQLLRADVSGWFGVQVRDGRVASLELPENNLMGSIPHFGSISKFTSENGSLDCLQKLDLSGNALVGELPVGLSELCSLTALDLGENSFRGPLPLLGLAKLKRMRSFRVPGNFLTGPLPAFLIGSWRHLRILDISDNQISGFLPVGALMDHCTQLERLEVARNPTLRGVLPLPFLHLTVAKLTCADFAGTLLAVEVEDADVMSEFDQEIRNAAGSESGSDASSSSSNGSWLGVGYWVNACAEAALERRGLNTEFARTKKAKMIKAAGVGAHAPAKKKAAALAAAAMATKVHKAAVAAAEASARNDSLMFDSTNGLSASNGGTGVGKGIGQENKDDDNDDDSKDLAPAGGWLRWLKRRLEMNGPSGMKPRDTFTRMEERNMDPRLLGRAPTLTNHFLFHCSNLTSYTTFHLAHPRFAIPHDTGYDAKGDVQPMMARRKLWPGSIAALAANAHREQHSTGTTAAAESNSDGYNHDGSSGSIPEWYDLWGPLTPGLAVLLPNITSLDLSGHTFTGPLSPALSTSYDPLKVAVALTATERGEEQEDSILMSLGLHPSQTQQRRSKGNKTSMLYQQQQPSSPGLFPELSPSPKKNGIHATEENVTSTAITANTKLTGKTFNAIELLQAKQALGAAGAVSTRPEPGELGGAPWHPAIVSKHAINEMETPPPPTRVGRARNAHAARHFPFQGGDQKNGDASRGKGNSAGGCDSGSLGADSVNMAEEFAHRFVQKANIFLQQQQQQNKTGDEVDEEEPTDFSYTRPEDFLDSKDNEESKVFPALSTGVCNRSQPKQSSLFSSSFTASLPPPSFLGKLVNLRLSCNRLTGPLPQSLSLLSQCTEICLDGNRFTGPILPNHLVIGLGAHLRHLELGSNRLTGNLQGCLERATTMTQLKVLGLSANNIQGAFGNFFGDDDDEGALLFPGSDKGFVASEAHAHMYGEFEPPVQAQQVHGGGGDSRKSMGSRASAHSPNSGSVFSGGGGGSNNKSPPTGGGLFGSFDTSGGNSRTSSGGGAATAAAAHGAPAAAVAGSFDGVEGGGSGTGSHSHHQSLAEKKLEARLSRRALLIGRRKWLLQLTALGIGGNAGLFGTLPPVVACLRMQGRLLIDLHGCGTGSEVHDTVDCLAEDIMDIEEPAESSDEESSSDDDDDDGGGGGGGAVAVGGAAGARRRAIKAQKRKARAKRRRDKKAARKKHAAREKAEGFVVSPGCFPAYQRGQVLSDVHLQVHLEFLQYDASRALANLAFCQQALSCATQEREALEGGMMEGSGSRKRSKSRSMNNFQGGGTTGGAGIGDSSLPPSPGGAVTAAGASSSSVRPLSPGMLTSRDTSRSTPMDTFRSGGLTTGRDTGRNTGQDTGRDTARDTFPVTARGMGGATGGSSASGGGVGLGSSIPGKSQKSSRGGSKSVRKRLAAAVAAETQAGVDLEKAQETLTKALALLEVANGAGSELNDALMTQHIPAAKVVDLTACSLYNVSFKELSVAVPNIVELRLPFNKLGGTLVRLLGRLSPLRTLQMLDLRGNRLRGCFVAQAKALLTALAILAPGVNLDGTINVSLAGSIEGYLNGSLQVLKLGGNPGLRGLLTGPQAEAKRELQRLEREKKAAEEAKAAAEKAAKEALKHGSSSKKKKKKDKASKHKDGKKTSRGKSSSRRASARGSSGLASARRGSMAVGGGGAGSTLESARGGPNARSRPQSKQSTARGGGGNVGDASARSGRSGRSDRSGSSHGDSGSDDDDDDAQKTGRGRQKRPTSKGGSGHASAQVTARGELESARPGSRAGTAQAFGVGGGFTSSRRASARFNQSLRSKDSTARSGSLEGEEDNEGDDGSSYGHLDNSTLDSADAHDDDYDDDEDADDLPLPMHYGSGRHDSDDLWNVKPIEPGVPVQMLPDFDDSHHGTAGGASSSSSTGADGIARTFPPLLGASATIRNFTLNLSAASFVRAASDAPTDAGGEEKSNALKRIDLAAVMRRAAKQVMPKNVPNVKVRPLELGSGSHALVTPRVGAPLRRSGGGAGGAGGAAKKPMVVKRTALGALTDGDGTSREGGDGATDEGENGAGPDGEGGNGSSSSAHNNTTDNDSDGSSGDTTKQGADAAAAAAKARLEEQARIAAENMTPPQMLDVHLGKTLIECDVSVDLSFVPPENENKGVAQKGGAGAIATLANVIDSSVAEQDALTAAKEKEAADKAAAAAAAAATNAHSQADGSKVNADGSVDSGSTATATAVVSADGAAAAADGADGAAVSAEGSTRTTAEQEENKGNGVGGGGTSEINGEQPPKDLPTSSHASLISADGPAASSSSSTVLSAPFVPETQREVEEKPPSKLELRAMELEEIAAELQAAQEVATASAAADTAEDIAAMTREDGEPGQPLQPLDARFYAVSVELLLAMRRFPSHEEVARFVRHAPTTAAAVAAPHAGVGRQGSTDPPGQHSGAALGGTANYSHLRPSPNELALVPMTAQVAEAVAAATRAAEVASRSTSSAYVAAAAAAARRAATQFQAWKPPRWLQGKTLKQYADMASQGDQHPMLLRARLAPPTTTEIGTSSAQVYEATEKAAAEKAAAEAVAAEKAASEEVSKAPVALVDDFPFSSSPAAMAVASASGGAVDTLEIDPAQRGSHGGGENSNEHRSTSRSREDGNNSKGQQHQKERRTSTAVGGSRKEGNATKSGQHSSRRSSSRSSARRGSSRSTSRRRSKSSSSSTAAAAAAAAAGMATGAAAAGNDASSGKKSLPFGCFGSEGFGWGSNIVPLRAREMWLEKPAGQFGSFPVQAKHVAFVQHSWERADPMGERVKKRQKERALALRDALATAASARLKASKETQAEADQAAAQAREAAAAAAAAAQEAATGPAPGSAGAKRLMALSHLGIIDSDSHSSLVGSSSSSITNNKKPPVKGMQAVAAEAKIAAATAPVSYAAASASSSSSNVVVHGDNASVGSTISAGVSVGGKGGLSAAIVRAAKEERRRQRRQHHLALRLAAEDEEDESHPDDLQNSKLKALQEIVRLQHQNAPTKDDKVKWVVIDFLAFPQKHRQSTQKAVQAGLPLACGWCGHLWTLAKEPSALRKMQQRAWVRLENMLALRADPCRDEDLSSESDPENEDNANDQNSSVHGNNGGMNSALTTSRSGYSTARGGGSRGGDASMPATGRSGQSVGSDHSEWDDDDNDDADLLTARSARGDKQSGWLAAAAARAAQELQELEALSTGRSQGTARSKKGASSSSSVLAANGAQLPERPRRKKARPITAPVPSQDRVVYFYGPHADIDASNEQSLLSLSLSEGNTAAASAAVNPKDQSLPSSSSLAPSQQSSSTSQKNRNQTANAFNALLANVGKSFGFPLRGSKVPLALAEWNADGCLAALLAAESGNPLNGEMSDARDWPTLAALGSSYQRPKRLTHAERMALARENAASIDGANGKKKAKKGRGRSRSSMTSARRGSSRGGSSTSRSRSQCTSRTARNK